MLTVSKKALVLVACLIVVVFSIGLTLGYFVPRALRWAMAGRPYNTATLLQQVQTVSELATVKYVIEKVVVLEDVKYVAVLGENRVLLLAHGVVKAGIDLSHLHPGDLQVEGKKVTIKLPPPRIIEAYLDDRKTRVIERSTGLLRFFDKDLEQNARVNAVTDIRRAANDSNILKEAETRARAQLTSLFRQMGFETVEFVK